MNRLRLLLVPVVALSALAAPAAFAGPDPCRLVACRPPTGEPKELVVGGTSGGTVGQPDWDAMCAKLGAPPFHTIVVDVPGHGPMSGADLCNIFVNGTTLCAFLMADPTLGPVFVGFCTGVAAICATAEDLPPLDRVCEPWIEGAAAVAEALDPDMVETQLPTGS